MIKKEYHYVIAGLPTISIGERLWTNMVEFRAHLEAHLHPEDFMLVKYILLQQDHQNLLQFLKSGDVPKETAGNFTMEDFNHPEDYISGTDPEAGFMPGYISGILTQRADKKSESGGRSIGAGKGTEGNKDLLDLPAVQRELDEGFFRLIMEKGNTFLRRYYTFHYNLNNLLTFQKTGAHRMDQEQYITGDTAHARHLREFAGRNLVKDPDFEHFDDIISITCNTSFAEAEKLTDQLRWRMIEEINRFEYFTIDRILGYLIQMSIAERWEQLDRESGEQQLRNIIDISYSTLTEDQFVQ